MRVGFEIGMVAQQAKSSNGAVMLIFFPYFWNSIGFLLRYKFNKTWNFLSV